MLKLLFAFLISACAIGTFLSGSGYSSAAPALAARTSDAAGVHVVVTPKAIGRDVAVWEFEVVMDTHTKPLSENLAQAAVLVDEAGGRFVPIAWQGDPPGGHHRKGILQFSAPAQVPTVIELQIDGVGGVATRKFRWELK